MSTFTKRALSGSDNGKGIKVAETATAGTTIHTAVAGETDWDEIWVWCVNTSDTAVVLTLEYGGVVDPNDLIPYTVAAKDGLKIILPGALLQNGLVLKAFAGTADVLIIHGFINRIAA